MIRFLYTTQLDSATVTSLNAATNYPASNVQTRLLKQTWRTTGLSNQWIKFDLGSAKSITMFSFFYNNLTSGATVTLYGHASNMGNLESDWSAATYKSTITSFDTRVGVNFPNNSLRWWLIGISDATNPSGYIELGRCYAGAYVSPDENFNEDFQETFFDPSLQTWSVGQHCYSIQRERAKEWNFTFTDISSANQTVLRNLWASVYKTEPFVIALDPSDNPVEFTRYGVLTSDLNFNFSANGRANATMTFKELR